jgi:hypothetical protein
VLDEVGSPVAGASLRLQGGESLTPDTTSDRAGRYRLDGIDPGERRVWVQLGEDTLEFPRVRIVRGENRLDFAFVRHSIRGRVLAPEGQPIAGAAVRLAGGSGRHEVVTGTDGTFAFQTVASWRRLDVTRKGYVAFHSRLLRAGGAAAQEIEIRLSPGATLTGRLLGLPPEDRKGIRVAATNRETSEILSGTVDPQGRYRIADVGAGTWRVTAVASRQWAEGDVTLRPEVREGRLDLNFPAYWPVSGRVLDANGTPVSAALVFLHSGKDSQGSTSSVTDGTFSLPLPDGVYEVMASAKGYAPTPRAEPVIVAGAAVSGVEIRLAAAARLTGRVLGLTSEELAESSVSASQGFTSQPAWLDDRDGRYAIEDLGPGDWTVSAYHQGEWNSARLHLAPGVAEATLDLIFVRGDLTLRGRLRGGDPLAAYVAELSQEGENEDDPRLSDPDGHGGFQFTGLRPGRYRLKIQDANILQIGGGPAYDQVIELTQDRDLGIELPAGGADPSAISACSPGRTWRRPPPFSRVDQLKHLTHRS